ncbi:hypothetical protein FRP1_30140 (plasmid) [Pseudonocardia sp. EC080625-04]|nr:TetR/AcrR family transcriptional regulator [Pseudonocardia sp. EC080619-01]ALE76981.1 hypothetical protein FRP1_30140 [Pseudonocardia sp. EC080625-04]ALL85918.1 hypothetical protein AD017_33015 [Pseudonocardia sp. EC080619-01]
MSVRRSSPGRPRSRSADAAILAAALDLLIDRGIPSTSVEQVARRAGVTRATVYRRFPDKTRLLIAAIESAWGDPPVAPEITDIEQMITGWAGVLAQPRQRRLLRRLYGAVDDDPELAAAYRERLGGARDRMRRDAIAATRDAGRLPGDTDPEVLLDLLTGAVWHHLTAYPDTTAPDQAERYLRALLTQAGYRPDEVRPPKEDQT